MGMEPTRQLVTGTLVFERLKHGTKYVIPQTLRKLRNVAHIEGLRVFSH